MAVTKYTFPFSGISAANSTTSSSQKILNPVITEENYIYISHLDTNLQYWRLPCVPDNISDSMGSTFSPSSALGRSAPVYTYSNSGPRDVQFSFKMHRDIMDDVNKYFSNSTLQYGEDYFDNLLHALQAIAVPRYNLNNKAVEPPLVAVRITNEIFIKGIVSGSVGVAYEKPILSNGKFAQVTVSFSVTEVDPYDASTIYTNGSFRGVVSTLKSGMGLSED